MQDEIETTPDEKIDGVVKAITAILLEDTIIRAAIVQGRKADVTIYLHRGAVARPPLIVFHPVP